MRGFVLLAVVCALGAAACGRSDEATVPAAPPPETATTPTDDTSRPLAPDVGGETLDGETASLAGLRGGPVFVNVWSSW